MLLCLSTNPIYSSENRNDNSGRVETNLFQTRCCSLLAFVSESVHSPGSGCSCESRSVRQLLHCLKRIAAATDRSCSLTPSTCFGARWHHNNEGDRAIVGWLSAHPATADMSTKTKSKRLSRHPGIVRNLWPLAHHLVALPVKPAHL